MRKILAWILLIAILGSVLAGCGSGTVSQEGTQQANVSTSETSTATNDEPAPQEIVKMKFVIPGNAPTDYDLVATEINKKLAADKMGIDLERVYIPWDAWNQKINLMLSTGEEFDLFHVMQDGVPYSQYYSKGALADITEYVEKYMDTFNKVIPENMWEGAKLDNKIYVVPTFWLENATEEGIITMRTDVLKKYNLEMPQNPDQFLDVYETVVKNWEGSNKPYLPLIGGTCDVYATHSSVLHRSYDSYPFIVRDSLFYIDQKGEVKSWIETEEFKKDCLWFREAYKRGIINPDVLTVKQEQRWAPVDSGDWFAIWGTGGNMTGTKKNNPEFTQDDVTTYYFNPEKDYVRPFAIKNCNAVPSTSKNPEVGVKFLSWLWSNQDNYNLYFYGIEGTHFNKTGDRTMVRINDPETNSVRYTDSDWMSGNINMINYDGENALQCVNKALYTVNNDAINSVAANFFFDGTNVKAELANVTTELAASIVPIALGVVDYEKAFPAALDKMKKAGLDKVMEEARRQFAEFSAK